MRVGWIALAALLLAPSGPRAQEPTGRRPEISLELHAGAMLPLDDALEPYGTGYSVGGTAGVRLLRNLSVEGELAYWQTSYSEGGVDRRISLTPVTASLRLRMPMSFGELSLLGGAGLHVVRYRVRGDEAGSPADDSDDEAVLGFHVGAALAFRLSPDVLAGAEIRRTFVEADLAGTGYRLDGLRIAVTATYLH